MLFDKDRKSPTPKAHSVCDMCNSTIIAKCGSQKVWHWAHESKKDCDKWYEPISEWHLFWQSLVDVRKREIRMGKHRADIKLDCGTVVEIQNSSISIDDVEAREEFYDNMVWVYNGAKWVENFYWKKRDECHYDSSKEYVTFYWKRARKYVANSTKKVFIDLGENILEIGKFYGNEKSTQWGTSMRYGGWGFLHEKGRQVYDLIMKNETTWMNQAPAAGGMRNARL